MTGEAAVSGLRFFLDRGLGSRIVPEALRDAGWALETMDERYGKTRSQEIKDTQWIEEATLAGGILLCKDLTSTRKARATAPINAGLAGPRPIPPSSAGCRRHSPGAQAPAPSSPASSASPRHERLCGPNQPMSVPGSLFQRD